MQECSPIRIYLFLTRDILDDTGATNPEYVVTADDVDKVIAVECIPLYCLIQLFGDSLQFIPRSNAQVF